MIVEPTLLIPQAKFITLDKKFRAFVAGYGSGKTWAGCGTLCSHAYDFPGVPQGYFAPTYPMIRDIFYPTIEEVAEDWGLSASIKTTSKEVALLEGKTVRSRIICRSMDSPGTIIGFKIGHAQVDEIDTLPLEKATAAWRKIIARLRYKRDGVRNGADVTTTPEGFQFVYNTFVKQVGLHPHLADLYGIVHASTYDNEANLPPDYIDSLYASYPANLVDAYINGKFVNLTSGSVYPNFDRKKNHADVAIKKGETLHIGLDFNVLNMAAEVTVTREGKPFVVEELTRVRDTPTMARMLKDRYQNGRGDPHAVVIYPDASGGNTSSKNASESDLTILSQAGFTMRLNPANPAVKDRVNALNAQIMNGKGERRLMVNTHACPVLTESLEQQTYDKNGEPDKTTGHDHPNDALGYRIIQDWPIVRLYSHSSPLAA